MGLNRNLLFGSHKTSPHVCWFSSELKKACVPPEFQPCDMDDGSADWHTSVLSLYCVFLFLFLYAGLQGPYGAVPCHEVPPQFLPCTIIETELCVCHMEKVVKNQCYQRPVLFMLFCFA